uniref:Uncharacterized protein n=1 Tax=Octopus bimaculoides TaxID=37653 RepID=A0A0L8FJL5_OCTBM
MIRKAPEIIESQCMNFTFKSNSMKDISNVIFMTQNQERQKK